jgi:hypothetical protein
VKVTAFIEAILACVVAFFAGTACNAGDDPATPSTADVPPQAVLDAARDDLARRASIASADIDLVERCSMTWPDSSLGVREPGAAYTTALLAGWLAVFEADGREYRYHGAGDDFIAADFVAGADVLAIRCP